MFSNEDILAMFEIIDSSFQRRLLAEAANFHRIMAELDEEEEQARIVRNELVSVLFNEKKSRPELYAEEWILRYNDEDFHRLFRMTRVTFHLLLRNLEQTPAYHTDWNNGICPISTEKKTYIGIMYLATLEPMRKVGDKFNVCDSTVLKCVEQVCNALCDLKTKYICLPNAAECAEIADQFQQIANFPGIVGAIDGSHIEGKFLKHHADDFINRKYRKSIILQGIVTAKKIFTNVFIGAPGRMHDARVLSFSSLYRLIQEEGADAVLHGGNYHIIGDSAYPLKTWLMVPFRNNRNLTPAEVNFNKALSQSRVVVENVFGLVKIRWQRLLYIDVNCVDKMCKIVLACCVLHNFCYLQEDFLEAIVAVQQAPTVFQAVPGEGNIDNYAAAQAKRNYIKTIL